MQITETSTTLYQKVTTYDYTPTPAELYYWYSGTHAGINPANPYARRYSMTVTKRRYVVSKEQPNAN